MTESELENAVAIGAANDACRPRATWPAGIDAEGDNSECDNESAGTSGLGSRAAINALLRRTVGRRFAEARALSGLDQGDAARRLGWENSTQLSLIEAGKRLPPHGILLRASEVLGVSLDFLMGASAEPERDPKTAERMALMRRAERMLRQNAEAVTESLMVATRETTLDSMRAAGFVTRASELVEAARELRRLNPEFDDARGGARLVRLVEEMEAAIAQVRHAMHRAERIHSEAIARARKGTTSTPTHQPSGTAA